MTTRRALLFSALLALTAGALAATAAPALACDCMSITPRVAGADFVAFGVAVSDVSANGGGELAQDFVTVWALAGRVGPTFSLAARDNCGLFVSKGALALVASRDGRASQCGGGFVVFPQAAGALEATFEALGGDKALPPAKAFEALLAHREALGLDGDRPQLGATWLAGKVGPSDKIELLPSAPKGKWFVADALSFGALHWIGLRKERARAGLLVAVHPRGAVQTLYFGTDTAPPGK